MIESFKSASDQMHGEKDPDKKKAIAAETLAALCKKFGHNFGPLNSESKCRCCGGVNAHV